MCVCVSVYMLQDEHQNKHFTSKMRTFWVGLGQMLAGGCDGEAGECILSSRVLTKGYKAVYVHVSRGFTLADAPSVRYAWVRVFTDNNRPYLGGGSFQMWEIQVYRFIPSSPHLHHSRIPAATTSPHPLQLCIAHTEFEGSVGGKKRHLFDCRREQCHTIEEDSIHPAALVSSKILLDQRKWCGGGVECPAHTWLQSMLLFFSFILQMIKKKKAWSQFIQKLWNKVYF